MEVRLSRGRRKKRRNVDFRRSCTAASALMRVPGAGYRDGFLSGCREEPERREREREKSRNKGSLTEKEEEEEEGARDPREVQMYRKLLYKRSSLRFRKLLLYCSNMCVQKMAVCTHRSQMVLFDI